MRWLDKLRLRLRSIFRKRQVERELELEMQFHIERQVQENLYSGMSADDARYMALRLIDRIEQTKEECRDMRRTRVVDELIQDAHYACRSLLKHPSFVFVTLLSLALGIGANSAIFSLLNKVLLESLPVSRPDQLVILNPQGIRNGWIDDDFTWSYPTFLGLQKSQQVFTDMFAERTSTVNFSIDNATQRATQSIVSGNYFQVLDVRALLGRILSAEDDRQRDAHSVAVLTYGFWMDQLGGRRDIVGHAIRLNGHPFTVVGVTEKGFNGLEVGGTVDIIVPVTMLGQVTTYGAALDRRSAYIFNLYGRLKPGLKREDAQAQMQPIYLSQLELDVAAMGAQGPRDEEWRKGQVLLDDGRRGISSLRNDLETPLFVLMAMTTVVLLIACANIAGLLMARGASRNKELSIRLAIGASRGRIVRQMLTETALLALFGGLCGLIVASWTINALVAETGDAQRLQLVTTFLDGRVLAFTLIASIVTGLLFGLLPALHASSNAVSENLTTVTGTDKGKQVRLRKALVTAQVALGLMLVSASGLFLRTLNNLRHTEIGFRTDHLIQFELNAGLAGYDRFRATGLFRDALTDLRSLPGVSDATLAVAPVLSNETIGFALDVEGYDKKNGQAPALGNAVAPGYFSALGMQLLRGRDFTESDEANSPRVAIVSESFVKRYFPDRDPLGLKIGLSFGMEPRYFHEIIGVVKDARIANLRDAPRRNFFVPYTQWNVLSNAYFFIRSTGDPVALGGSVREVVRQQSPDIPVVGYRGVEAQIDRLLRPERMVASFSLAFGLLATGLAAIGIYGVTAFSMERRRREIGIRMALGARRADVLQMVLRDVAMIATWGIAFGLVLSLYLTRYLNSQLYGVSVRDPLTLLGAVAVLTTVVLFSGLLPARRASRVDPVRALRQE